MIYLIWDNCISELIGNACISQLSELQFSSISSRHNELGILEKLTLQVQFLLKTSLPFWKEHWFHHGYCACRGQGWLLIRLLKASSPRVFLGAASLSHQKQVSTKSHSRSRCWLTQWNACFTKKCLLFSGWLMNCCYEPPSSKDLAQNDFSVILFGNHGLQS